MGPIEQGEKAMAKASFKLPNGTAVQIEGTPEEVQRLLEVYSGQPLRQREKPTPKPGEAAKGTSQRKMVNLAEIIKLIKDCNEAESIEEQILDKAARVDRTILPLYIVHEYMDNAFGLTSGEISKITTDLGIPISQSNASMALSGIARRYVIGDKVKTKGQAVRYKLSRKGKTYMKSILKGTKGGK
jgi:hypothetical protein